MSKTEISTYDFNNKQSTLGIEIIDLNRIVTKEEKAFKAHRLNFNQILIFTKGRGVHEVDFQRIAYSENTVIPIAMGQVQRFIFNPEVQGYAILFTPDFLVKENLDYGYLYDFTIFLHTISPISSIANLAIYTIVDEMISEQQKGLVFNTGEYQRNLLKNFLIQIERNKRERTDIVCNDSLDLFMNFRKLLEQNVNYKLRVVDLCDQLSISPKQLNASLKLYNNTTAKQYIEDRILLEVKRLLVYSALSIKEIAYEIGFDDPTNFTKYFKARMKILPTDYRKQYQ
ncbi:helix-turn-helix domain-containing protein [Labilibaculum sp.]|uniref:helix-turn-helix domain-containing protein n=1 Tax=Labilibaculum sp. TaxID=2060723 RepID=UPI003563E864